MIAQIDKVSKFYAKEDGLKSASFTLDKGQVVGLFGLNGSGKTTTIKLLAGLLRPDSGLIRINGGSVRSQRESVAYLTDRSAFYPWMNVKDVRRMMLSLFRNFDENLFQKLVSELDVPEKPLGQMSKGQSQRLRLVAAMARKASLYLLDEPLSGIDLVSRELIIKTLIKHWDQQSCILLSTHEIREVETFFDRGLFLKDGALVSDMMAEDLYRENKSFTDFFITLHHSGALS